MGAAEQRRPRRRVPARRPRRRAPPPRPARRRPRPPQRVLRSSRSRQARHRWRVPTAAGT
ncbi:MAG: hypothetical protein FJW86_02440 [Actinobacteria bacterium]|nr:hypothetical protein [Actinomycetota bacterium]